jgi:hypothetical protein
MKLIYTSKCFQRKTLKRIGAINRILNEYAKQGYQMTVRQLYYQMVSRKIIPFDNREYNKLITLIANGRNAGLIDWDHIVDRSRDSYQVPLFDSVSDALQQAADNYHIDLWEDMPTMPVIWYEKAGLAQIIGRVASKYNIEHMATRGENSLTWLHQVSQQTDIILYLGDHDGHGVQISDGMAAKVKMYSNGGTTLKRIGISLDHGEEINAPKIPLKDVTNLSFDYRQRFGCGYGYEIDALDPKQLIDLIEEEIESLIGLASQTFENNIRRQQVQREQIIQAVSA